MTKHKHYDMIIAKAENMKLSCLSRTSIHDLWHRQAGELSHVFFGDTSDYFLCLPEHAEACLHWLNGKTVDVYHGNEHFAKKLDVDLPKWSAGSLFMSERATFVVQKEKRKKWIVYRTDGAIVGPFDDKETADRCNGQVFEIEVV